MVLPPFTDLRSVQTLVDGDKLRIRYGAQDLSVHDSGAYTGEIIRRDARQARLHLRRWSGHSERRQYHGETTRVVNAKVAAAFRSGLVPDRVRRRGPRRSARPATRSRTRWPRSTARSRGSPPSRSRTSSSPTSRSGRSAPARWRRRRTPRRSARRSGPRIAELYSATVADGVRVLYGGSVRRRTSPRIMAQPDVDGALVGGASLDAEEFARIVPVPRYSRPTRSHQGRSLSARTADAASARKGFHDRRARLVLIITSLLHDRPGPAAQGQGRRPVRHVRWRVRRRSAARRSPSGTSTASPSSSVWSGRLHRRARPDPQAHSRHSTRGTAMAGGSAIRGSRVGAGPMGEAERGEAAPRHQVSFWCAKGHEMRPSFATRPRSPRPGTAPGAAAAAPRQGQPAGAAAQRAVQDPPGLRAERRTDADGEAILAEALAKLRARRLTDRSTPTACVLRCCAGTGYERQGLAIRSRPRGSREAAAASSSTSVRWSRAPRPRHLERPGVLARARRTAPAFSSPAARIHTSRACADRRQRQGDPHRRRLGRPVHRDDRPSCSYSAGSRGTATRRGRRGRCRAAGRRRKGARPVLGRAARGQHGRVALGGRLRVVAVRAVRGRHRVHARRVERHVVEQRRVAPVSLRSGSPGGQEPLVAPPESSRRQSTASLAGEARRPPARAVPSRPPVSTTWACPAADWASTRRVTSRAAAASHSAAASRWTSTSRGRHAGPPRLPRGPRGPRRRSRRGRAGAAPRPASRRCRGPCSATSRSGCPGRVSRRRRPSGR